MRAALCMFVLAFLLASAAHGAPDIALRGAAVLLEDGTVLRGAVVIVKDGRISDVGQRLAVPPGMRVLDLPGKYVIPGLAEMHTHFGDIGSRLGGPERELTHLLAWGITTVRCTGIPLESFKRLKKPRAGGPPRANFFGTGPGLTAPGGWPVSDRDLNPRTPAEARRMVATLARSGVDAIKVVYDDMSWIMSGVRRRLSPTILKAIIAEAHARRLRVLVHAPILEHAREALTLGADGLVHGVLTEPIDDAFVSLMRSRRASYVATLGLYEEAADFPGWGDRQKALDPGLAPSNSYFVFDNAMIRAGLYGTFDRMGQAAALRPVARANMTRLVRAGCLVTIGSDTGVTGMVPGAATLMEIILHVEAGLTPAEALGLATRNAGLVLGRPDLGVIRKGAIADLVVLDDHPLKDIRNLTRVHLVLRSGVPYTREQIWPQEPG